MSRRNLFQAATLCGLFIVPACDFSVEPDPQQTCDQTGPYLAAAYRQGATLILVQYNRQTLVAVSTVTVELHDVIDVYTDGSTVVVSAEGSSLIVGLGSVCEANRFERVVLDIWEGFLFQQG